MRIVREPGWDHNRWRALQEQDTGSTRSPAPPGNRTGCLLGPDTEIEENKPIIPREFEVITYPNPFNASVNIKLTGGEVTGKSQAQLEIFDITGKLILKEVLRCKSYIWTPSPTLGSGIYMVRITTTGTAIISEKIIYLQ